MSQHTNGNLLWHLVCTDCISRNRAHNIKVVRNEIQEEYRARAPPAQFVLITRDSFTDPAAPNTTIPKLAGKAAENRRLVLIPTHIFEKHNWLDNQRERIILKCARALTSSETCDEIKARVDVVLKNYQYLSMTSAPRKTWHMVSKFHQLWHLAQECVWLSPRFSWTYGSKGYMSTTSRVGLSCRHGTTPAERSKPVMEKHIGGLVLRLHHAASD